MRLRAAPDAPPQDFIVTVPAGRSAVYAGTFRRDCAGDAPSSCRLVPTAGDEAAARDAVPDAQRAAFPFVAAAAQPYPPRLAGTNLPPPVAPAIRADPVAWLSAVDWLGILDDRAASVARPAGDYTSGNLDPFGLAAALVLMVPIGLVVLAIQAQQRRSQQIAADDALTRAQALRARAEAVRTAWSPCEATIGDALAPDRVVERLAAAFPASRRATAAANPWQATVTRVALRHCGQGSDTFGVEVATRWTAPGYDASFVRPVQGATPDNRLRWSTPPPWEVQVAPAGACRPLAEWCAAGGRALLDDVTQSVLGARDAIAATR